ncbi:hypothetical protein BU24DRAFT_66926 [Aaosphaeria arxii CBS 175.79]|uniref:Uncharacterized protein n=1 Tax=Aaosphaeria arxii CBS 175.79 TaxID=1450172 RepID=A0A6A5XAH4_9PLEO|nr:uncharacterized protein BU24DRAFT_66926 [Aaosphaeria arxii CBS 175.79]KAF2009909.1 hypothetical protein BU24DRAFT_66926 [Aaosphaeria arxii CBS 175.79]
MLPALQPSRPKIQPPSRPITLPHQQIRNTHDLPLPLPTPPKQNSPPPQQNPTTRPRNQIEAMPPYAHHHTSHQQQRQAQAQAYDPAKRHPVFFTERLRKPPFRVPDVVGSGYSPVASGYIVERVLGVKGEGGGRTKL